MPKGISTSLDANEYQKRHWSVGSPLNGPFPLRFVTVERT